MKKIDKIGYTGKLTPNREILTIMNKRYDCYNMVFDGIVVNSMIVANILMINRILRKLENNK